MNADELLAATIRATKSYELDRPSADELRSLECVPISTRGSNVLFKATGQGKSWFIKFSRHNGHKIPDICEREALVSLLGEILLVPVVKAWVIDSVNLTAKPSDGEPSLIRDKCVLMPMIDGATAEESRGQAATIIRANTEMVADILAFMHWVGDEDRGLVDVLLPNGHLLLIDNGLCGPGRDDLLRGAHPDPQHFRNFPDAIVKKCFRGKPSLVAFILRCVQVMATQLRNPRVISDIEALPEDAIRQVVSCVRLAPWIGEVLILRQTLLRQSYNDWLSRAAQACAPI